MYSEAYNGDDKKKKEIRDLNRKEFMTDDELNEIDELITRLNHNKGYMSQHYSRWSQEEKAYRNDQDISAKRPNTRVGIMNAIIESQVSSLVDKNIAVICRGEGVSDEGYAHWAQIGLDWTLRKNQFKKILSVHERRRSLHGIGIFKVYFDPDCLYGFGLTKITAVPLNKIFIDTKIKDPLRFQEAEYVAETIRLSKPQIEELYGYEKASIIDYGNFAYEDTTTFNEEETFYDDENAATVIQVWSKHKGKLRLREITGCGLLLWDSHKAGERETNQKDKDFSHKSYYRFVNDKYPYFFTGMYPEEGSIWGFGDGTLLMPLQNMLNDMYDKIRMSARPNLLLFDPMSEVDLEDFDENSLEPRPADLSRGTAVQSYPWGQINESWWRLLVQIHQEIQRVARTSYMMLGQGGSADSATEAAIQQQQGAGAIDHKKLILQDTMIEMCEYILGLMMEFYTEAKSFRISEEKKDYEWIDFRKLADIPIMTPSTDQYKNEYKKKNKTKEAPEWMLLTDKNGKPVTKNVDFDIQISIGAGLPQNKAFIYQMAEKLSGLVVDGQNVIHYAEMRKFIKDFLGVPLSETDDELMKNMQQQAMGQMQGQPEQPMQSATTEGLSENNRPQMSRLPLSNTGGGLSGG